MPDPQLSARDILESIDKEIHFYRSRLNWIYAYSFAAPLLVVTGGERIAITQPYLGEIAYTIFLVVIGLVAWRLVNSYVERTYHLRRKRIEIVEEAGFPDVYTPPGGITGSKKGARSPSEIYLFAIWGLSAVAIIITWFGK